MGSAMDARLESKPHAVCVPYPAQGHINPFLKLAKILHHRGFHVTFVNTEYNHKRLLRSRGPRSLDGLPCFRFETIPDGLPPSDADSTQDVPSLCESTSKNCLEPLVELIGRLNDAPDEPKVSCVITDGVMSFGLDAAERIGVPGIAFWTPSACGVLGYAHYARLIEKGLVPLKDTSDLTNGYLNTVVDGIPAMKGIRLRDFPSFIRTTDRGDIMLNFPNDEIDKTVRKAKAVIINTFESLEKDVLNSLSSILPPLYTIGPLQLLMDHFPDESLKSMGSNLWREEPGCLEWLDSKEPGSVVYVNFGSITVMTGKQLVEFAWGLANSRKPFLWIIRPDLVSGESAVVPPEFLEETRGRGMLAGWCQQEQVLQHESVGGFLTHCGWNSTTESLCGGVPVICWPFFAEQQTNCWFSRKVWGIGMEIDNDVKREEVEGLVRELMDREKGKEMRRKAAEWKVAAEGAAAVGGSSYDNLEKLISQVLLQNGLKIGS